LEWNEPAEGYTYGFMKYKFKVHILIAITVTISEPLKIKRTALFCVSLEACPEKLIAT
jgi:hypothetical protein